MKVFIIAAVTADGFIGQSSSHLSTRWTSAADKIFFTNTTKAAGVIVMGRSTFETIGRALPGRRTIVLTSRPLEVDGVEPTSETPKELFERLEREGVQQLAICGGAKVYGEWMNSGLVQEIYLTVHPKMFGTGVPLLSSAVDIDLKLQQTRDIGDDTVLLHYSVLAK